MKPAAIGISCGLGQVLALWAAVGAFDGNPIVPVRSNGLPINSQSSNREHADGESLRRIGETIYVNLFQKHLLMRRSGSPNRRHPDRSRASSGGSSISAFTQSSSTSRSDWSELRHQKAWTSSGSSDVSSASRKSSKSSKETSRRSGSVSTSSKRSSTKSSTKSLGTLAVDGHSSDDNSGDERKYNSMLYRARRMGFNIRTDSSLSSWPRIDHEARNRYLRTPSRSPTHPAQSPTRSHHSRSHSFSDYESSSHSSRA